MTDIEVIRSTREKCFDSSDKELDEWLDTFRQAAEEGGEIGDKNMEYLLVQLIAYQAIYRPIEFKEVEDVYQRLVEQPWKDGEADFPLVLKLEFLSEKLCPEYKKSDHSEFSGFRLWKECMKGNQSAWFSMEKYNIQDIVATEQVFLKLAPWDNRLPNFDIYDDEPIDNKEWKHVGYVHTNLGKYDKYRNIITGQYRRGRTNLLSKDKRATILANIM